MSLNPYALYTLLATYCNGWSYWSRISLIPSPPCRKVIPETILPQRMSQGGKL